MWNGDEWFMPIAGGGGSGIDTYHYRYLVHLPRL